MTEHPHLQSVIRYRVLRWLLAPVVAVHNFEEWLTIPSFADTAADIAARFNLPLALPPWEAVQLALVLVTLVPALIVAWASLHLGSE
ncbi:MAG: hypothetical protein SFV19_06985 [Rhodospirillaceae bacterium]|nr:hypothetical protein [Rhodospirillaceae bacterium]